MLIVNYRNQWDYGGESQHLQVPLGSHQQGPDWQCRKKASRIIKDPNHPSHKSFCLLLSGRRYHSIRSRFIPQAVRVLNS